MDKPCETGPEIKLILRVSAERKELFITGRQVNTSEKLIITRAGVVRLR